MKSVSVGTLILAFLVCAIIAALLGGWGPMLAVGVIHIHWIAALPLLGLLERCSRRSRSLLRSNLPLPEGQQ